MARISLLALVFAVATLGVTPLGCGHKPPTVQFSLVGDAHLNPDPAGNPLPVVVYLYQLKRRDRFEQAEFRALWKSPADALGNDLVESQEITLRPGESRELQLRRNLDSRFLGVVALFRTPEGDRWKRIVPLEDKRKQSLRLALRGSQVELDVASGWLGRWSSGKGEGN